MILSSATQSESSKQSRLMPPETPAQSIVQPDKPVVNVHMPPYSSSETQLETETIDVSAQTATPMSPKQLISDVTVQSSSPTKLDIASSSQVITSNSSPVADLPVQSVGDESTSEQTATPMSPKQLISDVTVQSSSPTKLDIASSSQVITSNSSPVADRNLVDTSQQLTSCKSPEVILTAISNDPSPCSSKRGVPQWFKGNVSSAFSSHIFYPSPPKKKNSKLAPTQLFPACVSSQKWRELHRLKTVKTLPAVKTSTKKDNKVCSELFCVLSISIFACRVRGGARNEYIIPILIDCSLRMFCDASHHTG